MLTRRHALIGAAALAGAHVLAPVLVPPASAAPDGAELMQRLHAVLARLRTLPEMPEDPELRVLWHMAHMSPEELVAFAEVLATHRKMVAA